MVESQIYAQPFVLILNAEVVKYGYLSIQGPFHFQQLFNTYAVSVSVMVGTDILFFKKTCLHLRLLEGEVTIDIDVTQRLKTGV